ENLDIHHNSLTLFALTLPLAFSCLFSQLRYDGCEAIAGNLAKTTNIISPCPPSARLHQIVNLGLRAESEGARPENTPLPGLTNNLGPAVVAKGIDLEYEPEECNGHRRNGQASEASLGHLDLQKPTVSSDSGGESDRENIPPKEVQEHILKITKNKIAVDEINVVRSNGEMPLPNDELSADNICLRVKQELQKMNISQEVFAKCVLGKTQGYLSEMLKHGEKVFYSREKANSKGRMNFEKMRQFLLKPEEERRVIYADKARELREERLSRKRLSFTVCGKKLMMMAYSHQTPDDFKPSLSKLKCYSQDSGVSYIVSPETTPTHLRLAVSPHHPSEVYRNSVTVKAEHISPPRARERSAYENPNAHVSHYLSPIEINDRIVFMREGSPPSASAEAMSYSRKEPVADELQVDKHLVTTKIAALSRKQLTPTKTRPSPSPIEKEPVIRYYTAGEARRHSESEDSSYGIPEDVVTIETLPLQSLAAADLESNDDRPEPLVIRRASFDPSKIEIEHGTTPPAAMYAYYVTAHKAPCRTAAFSASVFYIFNQVLDVDRMVAKNTMPQTHDQGQGMNLENHPVIRTLYDHTEEVTALEFHPFASVLVSGSKDCTIKLFDISKPSVKKAYRAIQEAEVINSMSFHPSGDYIIVSTEHPTIRLYDINTFQCFVPANPREYHTGPVTMVRYAPTGNLYASSSTDGAIKVWDGVSNKCVTTFPQAHKGAEVYTVQFSHNSKYLISCGKDNVVFLWELSTGRAVNMYTGATMSNYRTQAVFNHTEDFILVADEKNNSITCWNTRSTEKQKSLSSGHNNHIRCIVHSPAGAAFVSCSDDFRARFWYCEGI
ncbi:hypothetical protein QZH41_017794, partial [Actinostola sp. cb2023]